MDSIGGTISTTSMLSTAKNLLMVTLGVEERKQVLFEDISNATQDAYGKIVVPLKFVIGDKLIVRINYDPASGHPTNEHVLNKSYKVAITLVAD